MFGNALFRCYCRRNACETRPIRINSRIRSGRIAVDDGRSSLKSFPTKKKKGSRKPNILTRDATINSDRKVERLCSPSRSEQYDGRATVNGFNDEIVYAFFISRLFIVSSAG